MSKADDARKREFAALFDAHAPMLLALLRRLTRQTQDAEEAFQETAIRVWKNLDRLPEVRNPRGWLTTTAYRVFLDQRGRRRPCEPLPDDREDPRRAGPLEQMEKHEAAERARALVAELPESARDLVALHYTAGLSLAETADVMKLPLGTIKSRLNQALSLLRRKLS